MFLTCSIVLLTTMLIYGGNPVNTIREHQTEVPTTPACTWWNRPEEDNSSGKLESTHPSRTSVKSDQGFFGVESVMRVNADSLLIRAAATSTSGTLNDLTTDLIMANNNNNSTKRIQPARGWCAIVKSDCANCIHHILPLRRHGPPVFWGSQSCENQH